MLALRRIVAGICCAAGHAGLQSLDFTKPATLTCLDQSFMKVSDDLAEPVLLRGIRAQPRAPDTACSWWRRGEGVIVARRCRG